jgi:hypothetical protein
MRDPPGEVISIRTTREGTREVTITTTRKHRTPKGRWLWSGRFHFLVRQDCDIPYLRGAKGGFVSAIAVALADDKFVVLVNRVLRDRMLRPDDERDQVEEITAAYLDGKLSDEWDELCASTLETGEVAFNEFDLYDSI